MKFRGFFSPVWDEIFSFNQISDFNSLCALLKFSFEDHKEPNLLINSIQLNLPRGGKTTVLIKLHIPTSREKFKKKYLRAHWFKREIDFFLKLKKLHIPSPEIIYFNFEKRGLQRSLLIICEPTHFNSLQKTWIEWKLLNSSLNIRIKVLTQIAELIHLLHEKKIVHNQLTTEHIHIRYRELCQGTDCDKIYVQLLGLEKAKKTWFKSTAMLNDLSKLFASSKIYSYKDKLRFYKFYCFKRKLSLFDKWRLKKIFKRTSKMVLSQKSPALS